MIRKITSSMKKIKLATLILLFVTAFVNAQVTNFNLSVSKTDETCLGNGSLTFTVSNTTPGASMLYKVYKLPNTTSSVAVLTTPYLGSLGSGTYKVVALQSLGSQLGTKEKTVTIANAIVPLVFTLSSDNQNCATGGSIIVETTSGTFASCEIIGGPVLRPIQISNVFESLPAGTYKVRVFNNCGAGIVKTYTLSLINAVLNISDAAYPDTTNPLCDSFTVNNTITPSAGTISYPLTVKHTLSALDISGNEIVIDQYFAEGDPNSLTVSAVLPRYQTQSYTYELKVSDGCSANYANSFVVDPAVVLSLAPATAPCANKFLKLNVSRYVGSYTVNFISVPAGFNPASFNNTPAGPFTASSVSYGSASNPVPFGTYVVEITDSCGRTDTETLLIEFVKPVPSASATNNGCFSLFGRINLSVPDTKIVIATITAAPAAYTQTQSLPHDVSSVVNAQGELNLLDMPIGTYTITFTDNCGFTYSKNITVPPFVEKDFFLVTLPACEPGFGTVRYQSGNGDLTNVQITAAPSTYAQSLPYDVSANIIANGDFYMGNLPAGTYTFTGTDICGIVKEKTIDVIGYTPATDNFTYTANCGSFSIKVTDSSNGTEGVTYWMQKYYPESNAWGNMYNGTLYTEGQVPVAANSQKLLNYVVKNNINLVGKFRIIKKFETFSNASSANTICLSVLGEFTYTDQFSINTAYSLACVGKPNDVLLDITGQPTAYRIIEKNGAPYSFDNGTSNIFVDLAPAEYVFQIEDDCGNIVTQGFNVQTLPSIADATQPEDLVLCVEANSGGNYQFNLKDQDDDILGPLNSNSVMYTITYHATFEDADMGVNAIPALHMSAGNGEEIFARLVHNEISLCHGVTSFKLFIGQYREATIATVGTICNEGRILLKANAGFSSYLWSNGATTQNVYVTEPGIYSLIAENGYGTTSCDSYVEVEIKGSETPEIKKIDTKDWTQDENMITVYATGEGSEMLYSLDGVKYQHENVFTGLEAGVYTVYVKDAHGCGQDTKEIVLLNYPNYFTPNGDGSHETWNIRYAAKEPHMKVVIMDRYGKIITAFGSTSKGWDGTLNGIQLPSTDYWFVVTREDGKEHRGHFAMLR